MNPSDDEMSGIFDHLNPEDFSTDTSAVDESSRENKGVEAFNTFVDEQLRAVRLAYTASEGNINPVAILASRTRQRVFTPDDDENMGQYVQRLNREAKVMAATWVFISRKTLVATHEVSQEDMHDVNDPDVVQAAIAEGRLKVGLVWFAERREGDERHRRHGIIESVGGHQLGQPAEGQPSQALPLFDRILG